jgi:hypothetical protein
MITKPMQLKFTSLFKCGLSVLFLKYPTAKFTVQNIMLQKNILDVNYVTSEM